MMTSVIIVVIRFCKCSININFQLGMGQFQELLHAAVSVEEERDIAAQKLGKKLQLAELTHKQREQVWLEEMTEGILDHGKEIVDDEVEADERRSALTKRPVRAEDRKTKKQRRKEKQRKKEVRS